MRRWWLVLALGLSACSRCRAPVEVADAGARVHRSTDLRTSIFVMYPEFRGARVLEGRAELVRTLDRAVPIAGAVLEEVKLNGFAAGLDGGALEATRDRFLLRLDGPRMTVGLGITEEDIGKLLNSPVSLTTEQLALWYPKAARGTTLGERFHLRLVYDSADWRSAFLVWQMVDLNTRGSWKVDAWPPGYQRERNDDGGAGDVPGAFSLTMRDSNTAASIELSRDGGRVELDYRLVTEGGQEPAGEGVKEPLR